VLAFLGASCVLIIAAVLTMARGRFQKHASANTTGALVANTVNLRDAGTTRGAGTGTLRSVSLPAAMVRVTVILPPSSAPGLYLVAVTNRSRKGVIAEDWSASETNEDLKRVSVDLDLRNVKAGEYLLSTARVPDQVWYNYPLRIK
jgi:hypothetical protein